jgi:hypothetical protein
MLFDAISSSDLLNFYNKNPIEGSYINTINLRPLNNRNRLYKLEITLSSNSYVFLIAPNGDIIKIKSDTAMYDLIKSWVQSNMRKMPKI